MKKRLAKKKAKAKRKLTIEIPDWAEGRPINIFVQRESYMHVGRDGTVYKKTVRCDMCGKCCRLHPDSSWSWRVGTKILDDQVYCKYTYKESDEFHCRNSLAPFSCCSDNPSNRKHKGKSHLECCIEYEVVGSV